MCVSRSMSVHSIMLHVHIKVHLPQLLGLLAWHRAHLMLSPQHTRQATHLEALTAPKRCQYRVCCKLSRGKRATSPTGSSDLMPQPSLASANTQSAYLPWSWRLPMANRKPTGPCAAINGTKWLTPLSTRPPHKPHRHLPQHSHESTVQHHDHEHT